jgi:2-polyprenyl-6-methoxyphenol hydroxylase-like FAD-dependent oxidoreductase
MTKQITIIGGGIAGLTAAIALEKIGVKTVIFEALPSVKAIGAGLGLGANAIIAFDRLGIKDEVIKRGRVLPSFIIYDTNGKVIT